MTNQTPQSDTDFGFEQVPWSDKARRVRGVFDSVAGRYDSYSDFGDDQSLTTRQARISLERDSNGAPVWPPLNKQPTLTNRRPAPAARVSARCRSTSTRRATA